MEYYEVLGLSKTATIEEITKSYRQKAVQYHPDKNPGDASAIAKFKACTEAYEVLGDMAKRSQYDVQGYVGRRPPNFRPPPTPERPKKPVKTAEDFIREREEGEAKKKPTQHNLDAIQCSFFGGGATGRNIMVHVYLTPEEMRDGGKFMALIKKRELCDRCIGDGTVRIPCPDCSAFARTSIINDYCPKCHGQRDMDVPCKLCNGEGVAKWNINEVWFTVPSGASVGQQIRLVGEGECAPSKMPGYAQIVLLEKKAA
jgi:molecular chaperone DnaJ